MAIALVVAAAWMTREPAYSAREQARLAERFEFRELPLPGASKARPRTIRAVQPQLHRIAAWISSVGAAVALTDADRDGLPNDVCLVDPRTDSVTLAPAPASRRPHAQRVAPAPASRRPHAQRLAPAPATGPRYAPFLLDAAPLPHDPETMAPTGCLPGDFDEDGRTDFLVYYFGRAPVLFLRSGSDELDGDSYFDELDGDSYVRRELASPAERWYTDAVTSADVDGDGHADLLVGNYFRDGSRVLDASATSDPEMEMQDSMSRAYNGGVDRVYLWEGPGRYREAKDALPSEVARGWTLALGASDLNGDLLPEVYFAHDFGPDRLLVNRSTPGRVRFAEVTGRRTLTTAASKVLGHDSFKGMGVDFGDLNADGRLDIMVSNITSEFALQESNFAWANTGERLEPGSTAPFVDRSEDLGLARSGWAWDVKLGDFDNDGMAEIVQAMGFMQGEVDRWPELHEFAMGNDELLRHPWAWPRLDPDTDISGRQRPAFFVRGPGERYVDVSERIGFGEPGVTRGVSTADVQGDGKLDFAVAGQWAPSHLYLNRSPRAGAFLGLDLRLAPGPAARTTTLKYPAVELAARPAIGASAAVLLPGGRRLVGQVDGGNGHASVRAPQLLFGLGRRAERPVAVRLRWRDAGGEPRRAALRLRPGWHTVLLGAR